MKKLFLIAFATLILCCAASVQAQDRQAIVGPFLQQRGIAESNYPADKFDYKLQFSLNSFYLTNTLPSRACVFEFSELTNKLTQEHPTSNVVDLNTLSYYTYNFLDFQVKDYHNTIYFRIGNECNRYLAVRSYDETMDRTNNPEKYQK